VRIGAVRPSSEESSVIHHLAVFDFHDDASSEAIDTLRSRLRALPTLISDIASYDVVDDLGLRETNSAMAVIAQFPTTAAFLAYVEHDAHQSVVTECIAPIVSKRSSLQYET
jgi:hypothetical protein